MRLNEILMERVSVSDIGDKAFDAMMAEMPDHMNSYLRGFGDEMPFTQISPDNNERIDHTAGQARFVNFMGQELAKILMRLGQEVNRGKRNNYDGRTELYVRFFPVNKGSDGNYVSNHNGITINSKYAKQLGIAAYAYAQESFINNDFQIIPNVFDGHEHFWKTPLERIAEIFVHELAHGEQSTRASDKIAADADHAYSSYQVDKKKFHELMKQELWTLEKNEAYVSSPQEIDSFSQEFVYKLFKDIPRDDELSNQLAYAEELMQYLNDEIQSSAQYGKNWKDHKDPAIQKARRRFMKRVYQEMDARCDKLKAAIKDSKNASA